MPFRSMYRRRRYMPSARRSTYRRRPTYRRRRRAINAPVVKYQGVTLPDRSIIKLPWTLSNFLTGTAVTNIFTYMNINSPYNPWGSLGETQPLSYDQWANFYNRYRVFSFRYNIEFVNNSTVPLGIVIYPTNNSTSVSTPDQAAQQRYAQRHIISANAGMNKLSFNGVYYLPRISGATPSEYKGSDRYQALYNASPTEDLTQNWFVYTLDGTSQNINLGYALKAYFMTEMFDRNQLPTS